MHEDPEFEKQIRQRMEELKFSPSKTVWDNLEKEITKDKSRRRPLIWFSFFLALLVAGTFYFSVNSGNKNADHKDIAGNAGASGNTSEKNQSQKKSANDQTVTLNEKENKNNNDTKLNGTATSDQKHHVEGPKSESDQLSRNSGRKKISGQNPDEAGKDFPSVNEISKNKKGGKNNVAREKNKQADDAIKKEIVDEQLAANKDNHDYVNGATNPDDKAVSASDQTLQKADSVVKKTVVVASEKPKETISQNKKEKNKKPWEFGFTGGAGVSSVNENLFTTTVAATPNVYTQSFSLAAAPPPPSYNAPSSIKAGFSYSAGVFAQKGISKRLSFSVGLNYHYSSTKLQASTYTYYAASSQSHTYTNRYHVLELPVALSYRFNKSNRFPLIWEAGLSVAELVGSDAVHYNITSGSYFKDNSLFNKTQVNAATSVMIGFHANKHLYFQAGPQVQYGLTDLLTSGASGSQHLFFGGIKFVFIPNKK